MNEATFKEEAMAWDRLRERHAVGDLENIGRMELHFPDGLNECPSVILRLCGAFAHNAAAPEQIIGALRRLEIPAEFIEERILSTNAASTDPTRKFSIRCLPSNASDIVCAVESI